MFRDIEVFRSIMTCGSANKAAALLGISQPSVSQSLQRLEARAGMQLFNRVRGRLQPTPEAHAFLLEVDRCFVGLEALEHRLRSLKLYGVGHLSLASFPAFGTSFLPRALARLQAEMPSTTISLQVLSSQGVRDRLLSGQCDIGLMADESSTSGIDFSIFAQIDGAIVMHNKHPLCAQRMIRAAELANWPFLSLNPEDAARRRLEVALAERAIQPAVKLETQYGNTICELVLSNVGIGLVNPISALSYVNRGLVMRKFEISIPFNCIMGLPAGKPLSSHAKDFIRMMRQQLHADITQCSESLGGALGSGI